MAKPIDADEEQTRRRDAFFEFMNRAAERAAMSPDEADQLANAAVEAIRGKTRRCESGRR